MENFDKDKKNRQIDNLIDLVENHTRTQRHLEQYSNIGDKDNKEHARDVQEDREEQIENLRNKLNGEDDVQTKEEQLKNLEEKYTATAGYIKNNKDNMNDEMLRNIEKKQEKRKNQINDYVD